MSQELQRGQWIERETYVVDMSNVGLIKECLDDVQFALVASGLLVSLTSDKTSGGSNESNETTAVLREQNSRLWVIKLKPCLIYVYLSLFKENRIDSCVQK